MCEITLTGLIPAIQRNWQHRTHKTKTINVREYRRSNKKWTIQRNWQHRVHKTKKNTEKLATYGTQDEEKHNTIYVGFYCSFGIL
jgi:hypothetical protein